MWTVGHSTRSMESFLNVLQAHRIELIADVRQFPGSRRLPHFGSEALQNSLEKRNIAYLWLPGLGGRRRPDPQSINIAWRHPAFRAYADHLSTELFAEGFFELLTLAHGLRTAVMCAEILWWRCHRRLISDLLVFLGVTVLHIRDDKAVEPHQLRLPAQVRGGRLVYDKPA